MSNENVETVRRHLAPYDGRDLVPLFREAVERLAPAFEPDAVLSVWSDDPSWRHLHPEVVWEIFGGGPLEMSASGPTEIARWWADAWESYVYRVAEYRDLGEWVTAVDVRATGRGGIPVEMRTFEIRRIRDGKIDAVKVFGTEPKALEAAGLSG